MHYFHLPFTLKISNKTKLTSAGDRYGGLISEGGLFNLDTTIVSVLHKKTRIQSGKAQVQKVLGHAAEDQNQIRASSW